jgi:RNA polymerase sigma-70 factor (ECF subfamily)
VNLTEDIWHEYHSRLASFIRTKVSEDMLDDILQVVFIKVHTRLDSLKDDTKIESWLYQITRNTIIDHYRSRQSSEQLADWIEQTSPEE